MASDVARAPPRWEGIGQWGLVAVLTVLVTLNYVDRGGINVIVNPIKQDLGVSDVQMSLLLGLSFVTLYSVCTIPAGHLADLFSRRLIIFAAVLFWSCVMALSGGSSTYWQLFIARLGLGVGEAFLPPAAFSLLRDGVEPKHYGRAYAVYAAGSSWGLGLGALIAGGLYQLGGDGFFEHLPVIGHLKPWQLALTIPGLCGIPVAFLIFAVREPPRRRSVEDVEGATFAEAARYICTHWRLYGPVIGASTIGLLGMGGWQTWMAAGIGRQWDLTPQSVAHMIGLFTIVLSPLNNILVGLIMDHFSKGVRPEMYLRVAAAAFILNLPPAIYLLHAPNPALMWGAYALFLILNAAPIAFVGTTLAALSPGRLMGKVTALYFLIANLLGFALGPTIFALVSERFFTGPTAIVNAMTVCYPAFMVVNIALLLFGAREIRRWRMAAVVSA